MAIASSSVAGHNNDGAVRIGFGEVEGRLLPARSF